MVGHCRFATSGKANVANTHPFENNKWIWAHNGVIDNFDELKRAYDDKLTVDSQILGYMLSKKGAFKNLSEVQGSVSAFMFSKAAKELYYIRHRAKFKFFLVSDKNNNKFMLGCTDSANIKNFTDTDTMKGFPIRNCNIISSFTPEQDRLYKINDEGLIALKEVTFKEDYTSPSVPCDTEQVPLPPPITFSQIKQGIKSVANLRHKVKATLG
jgi:hypothetical protein